MISITNDALDGRDDAKIAKRIKTAEKQGPASCRVGRLNARYLIGKSIPQDVVLGVVS